MCHDNIRKADEIMQDLVEAEQDEVYNKEMRTHVLKKSKIHLKMHLKCWLSTSANILGTMVKVYLDFSEKDSLLHEKEFVEFLLASENLIEVIGSTSTGSNDLTPKLQTLVRFIKELDRLSDLIKVGIEKNVGPAYERSFLLFIFEKLLDLSFKLGGQADRLLSDFDDVVSGDEEVWIAEYKYEENDLPIRAGELIYDDADDRSDFSEEDLMEFKDFDSECDNDPDAILFDDIPQQYLLEISGVRFPSEFAKPIPPHLTLNVPADSICAKSNYGSTRLIGSGNFVANSAAGSYNLGGVPLMAT
jgi:hypothetical protein